MGIDCSSSDDYQIIEPITKISLKSSDEYLTFGAYGQVPKPTPKGLNMNNPVSRGGETGDEDGIYAETCHSSEVWQVFGSV